MKCRNLAQRYNASDLQEKFEIFMGLPFPAAMLISSPAIVIRIWKCDVLRLVYQLFWDRSDTVGIFFGGSSQISSLLARVCRTSILDGGMPLLRPKV